MRILIGLLCLAIASKAENFITFEDGGNDRDLLQCRDESAISCRKVNVDLEKLFSAEKLTLPEELIGMTRSLISRSEQSHITFENPDEFLQGVFVKGSLNGQSYVAGSINWGRMGRHFRLETCAKEGSDDSCFLWKELNQNYWANLGESKPIMEPESDATMTRKEMMLMAAGREDNESMAKVSLTVYTTPEFRKSFASPAAMQSFIDLAIAETNQGYVNSQVPIFLYLHCLRESSLKDRDSLSELLGNFTASATAANLRRGADIAVIMTTTGDACGLGKTNSFKKGNTFGVVKMSCATGYYSFGHEMGHMYGCLHNKEDSGENAYYPGGNGFLMQPPVKSGYRTILAYAADGYKTRINYYSSDTIKYNGIPTGDANDNNAAVLRKNRFSMAAVGEEKMSCSD